MGMGIGNTTGGVALIVTSSKMTFQYILYICHKLIHCSIGDMHVNSVIVIVNYQGVLVVTLRDLECTNIEFPNCYHI